MTRQSHRSQQHSEVKEAKFYSIIADEVTDVSNKEELSLVVRYLHKGNVKEVFVDFLEMERITGGENRFLIGSLPTTFLLPTCVVNVMTGHQTCLVQDLVQRL